MRLLYFIVLQMLLFTNMCFGQTEAKVLEVRSKVQEINTYSNYKIKNLDNNYFVEIKDEVTDGGQDLKGFYKGEQLKKIVYVLGLSYGFMTTAFYFSEEKLIFVYQKQDTYEYLYNNDSGKDANDYTKVRTNFEGRFYFEEDKIFKSLIKGAEIMNDWDDKEEELLTTSKALAKELDHIKK